MSTAYPDPNFDPPEGWPTARHPGARVRLLPNESTWIGPLREHMGELTQSLVDIGVEHGISVDLDSCDRTRPGEMRGGASPIEVITLVLAGLGGRELARLADRLFDTTVEWILRRRRKDPPGEPIAVRIYGPNGETLREVLVDQDGTDP